MKPSTRSRWSGRIIGPMLVAGSHGSPTTIWSNADAPGREELVVLVLVHEQPGQRGAALAAVARPAQVHLDGDLVHVDVRACTRLGDLPPSSSVTPLRFCAACAMIFAPTPSEPVNETRSTPGCEESCCPTSAPPMIDVHDARRQAGLLDQVAEEQRGQRRPRRRAAGRPCSRRRAPRRT